MCLRRLGCADGRPFVRRNRGLFMLGAALVLTAIAAYVFRRARRHLKRCGETEITAPRGSYVCVAHGGRTRRAVARWKPGRVCRDWNEAGRSLWVRSLDAFDESELTGQRARPRRSGRRVSDEHRVLSRMEASRRSLCPVALHGGTGQRAQFTSQGAMPAPGIATGRYSSRPGINDRCGGCRRRGGESTRPRSAMPRLWSRTITACGLPAGWPSLSHADAKGRRVATRSGIGEIGSSTRKTLLKRRHERAVRARTEWSIGSSRSSSVVESSSRDRSMGATEIDRL